MSVTEAGPDAVEGIAGGGGALGPDSQPAQNKPAQNKTVPIEPAVQLVTPLIRDVPFEWGFTSINRFRVIQSYPSPPTPLPQGARGEKTDSVFETAFYLKYSASRV